MPTAPEKPMAMSMTRGEITVSQPRLIAHGEVVFVAVGEAVGLADQAPDLGLRSRDLRLGGGGGDDLGDAVLAVQSRGGGGVGDEDDVVGVVAGGALTLGGEDADDLEGGLGDLVWKSTRAVMPGRSLFFRLSTATTTV